MQTRSWDDKTSGEKKYRTEIVAEILPGRRHDLQRQVERHFVIERERPDRHPRHPADSP